MTTAAPPVLGHAGELVDLLLRQGATFGPHDCTLTNPDETPVDLTGAIVRAQIRRKALDVAVLATITCTITNAAAGQFTMGLTAAQTGALTAGEVTANIASRGVWDLELVDSLGRVIALAHGAVLIHREVTR